MHPINEGRMLAGVRIDPELEKIKEARTVPLKRSELSTKSEATIKAHVNGCQKAIKHIRNAILALERIPAHSFAGDIPAVVNQLEEILSTDNGEVGLRNLCAMYEKDLVGKAKTPIKEMEMPGMGGDGMGNGGGGIDPAADVHGTVPTATQAGNPKPSGNFKKGEVIMFDNGVWVVYLTDPQSDKIGIIPPGLADAEEEECSKAMQLVDPSKVRKPDQAELKVLPGPDGKLGTADDIVVGENMTDMMTRAMTPSSSPVGSQTRRQVEKKLRKQKAAEAKKKRLGLEKVGESTQNYTKSNDVSWEDEETDPVSVVGQGEQNWANSLNPKAVKNEYPSQLDNRGEQSMDEYEAKVKIPAKVTKALKDAIAAFEADAMKPRAGQSATEASEFSSDTGTAFTELLKMLEGGTIQDMKKAQVYATAMMGPMLHKLPDEVWDFVSNGGQKRSLKDYINPIKKFPIEGPRNS